MGVFTRVRLHGAARRWVGWRRRFAPCSVGRSFLPVLGRRAAVGAAGLHLLGACASPLGASSLRVLGGWWREQSGVKPSRINP